MANPPPQRKWHHRLGGASLAATIHVVRRTSTIVTEPADLDAHFKSLQPFIFCMWHGQFMLLPSINTSKLPTRIILARHDDAEVLGDALNRFGMELVRGAGANGRKRDQGGAAALRGALKTLSEGATFALTADIPPGPARKAGMGIVTIARMSGRPIVPVAAATNRYLSFNTWSRLTLNLPFSRLAFAVGEPIWVPRNASPEELEGFRQLVEAGMNATTARAYELARANPARSMPTRRSVSSNIGHRPIGWKIKAYQGLTKAAQPLSSVLLGIRERQGKEEANRRPERLGIASKPRPEGTLAWIHAASVGETMAILPLMDALRRDWPHIRLVLTTGTVTSAQLAASRLPEDVIHQYIPLDAPGYMARFLDHWRPQLAVLTESEIWPNLVLEASARGIPIALVNARMSQRSLARWRKRSDVAGPLFSRLDVVVAQNEKLARRFAELGAPNTLVAGNLKIDAPPPPIDAAALGRLRDAICGRPQFIAASTHDGEDQIVAAAHRAMAGQIAGLITVIAPRHPERGHAIAGMLKAQGLVVAQRSLGELPKRDSDIYVADTIGELGTLYALSPVAFIGGSLVAHGGQNPIEAVRHGAAVVTGPYWQNFQDAYTALLRHRGAIEAHDAAGLATAIGKLLCDVTERERMRASANDALAGLSGALSRTLTALAPLLTPKHEAARVA